MVLSATSNKVLVGLHTGEDGRLEKLNQFVDLDKHVDCHLQFRTVYVSFSQRPGDERDLQDLK